MNLLIVAIFLVMVMVWVYQRTTPTPDPVPDPPRQRVLISDQLPRPSSPPPRKLTVKPPVSYMLSLVKGGQLTKVQYVLANYIYGAPKYEAFHMFDFAILMQFSNGLWINWIFEEVGEVGPEFQLTFRDMQKEMQQESLFKLEDASYTPEWKPYIGATLTEAFPVYSTYDHGAKWLTDLVLKLGDEEVTICAIPEPTPERLPEIDDFSISNDWAIVVFDQELVRQHGRGKYGPSTAMI